jgi:hypothetical protein
MIYFLIEIIVLPFFILIVYAGFPSCESTIEFISWLFVFLLFFFWLLSPIFLEIFGLGSEWFILDASGVTYTTRKVMYHLDWTQVNHIMLSPDRYGRTTKNCFICFYAEEVPRWMPMRSDYTSTAFGIQYRKGLPEAIAKYCDLPIENIEAVLKRR